MNKYKVKCKGQDIDVYDVLKSFDVRCPATQHAIKKILKAGQRGSKDVEQDLCEAIISIERAKELLTVINTRDDYENKPKAICRDGEHEVYAVNGYCAICNQKIGSVINYY